MGSQYFFVLITNIALVPAYQCLKSINVGDRNRESERKAVTAQKSSWRPRALIYERILWWILRNEKRRKGRDEGELNKSQKWSTICTSRHGTSESKCLNHKSFRTLIASPINECTCYIVSKLQKHRFCDSVESRAASALSRNAGMSLCTVPCSAFYFYFARSTMTSLNLSLHRDRRWDPLNNVLHDDATNFSCFIASRDCRRRHRFSENELLSLSIDRKASIACTVRRKIISRKPFVYGSSRSERLRFRSRVQPKKVKPHNYIHSTYEWVRDLRGDWNAFIAREKNENRLH